MLLGEPPRSQWDLSFRLWGFPIRVSVWFWVAALLLGWSGSRGGDPHILVSWIAAAFASILIHELGHALAFRHFGIPAHIVLYHFGGLAVPDTAFGGQRGPRSKHSYESVLISLAGPASQLIAGAGLIVIVLASGNAVLPNTEGAIGGILRGISRWLNIAVPMLNQPPTFVDFFLFFFLQVSIFWALLNLIPVYPLDGGQVSRELFLMWDSQDAIRNSLVVSILAAGLTAIWGFMVADNTYLGIMFGMLGYSSYQTLQAYLGRGDYGGRW